MAGLACNASSRRVTNPTGGGPMKTVSGFVCLLLIAFVSCKTGPKGDLRDTVGQDVRGYVYSKGEDDSTIAEAVINPAVVNATPLDKNAASTVVGFKRVTDKKTNTTRTYRTEARRSGEAVSLVATDVATNQAVLDIKFDPPVRHGVTTYDTLQECINDFFCHEGAALKCEANKTCKDQFAALICCLKNGTCFSVHLVIRPTTIRCQLIGPLPDDVLAIAF